jgi:hypothetical protein
MKTKTYTSAELVAMLRAKYSGSAYVVLEQVANGTGSYCDSWIDATVFSLWPSNGIWRAACEVKVSRADFLKELSQPNKNQWAREHFDFFWYVVAPGVAKDDEIPTGTGLMTVRGGGLSIVKQAPRRENTSTDNELIASFARSLDKERERFVKDSLREAMEGHRDYCEARHFRDGCTRYLRECDSWCHPGSADEVYQALHDATRDKSPLAAEAEHVQRCLEMFHDRVQRFLLDVAPFAANILNARDEAGEFIVKRWGGRDDKSIESLKRVLKQRGRRNSNRDDAKMQIAVREMLSAADSGKEHD